MITLEDILAKVKMQIEDADEDGEIYIAHAEALVLKEAGAVIREKMGELDVASSGRHFILELNGIKFTHTCYPGNPNCDTPLL